MKKFLYSLMMIIMLIGLVACKPVTAPLQTEAPVVETEAVSSEPILELVGNGQTLTYSLADLEALPATEGYAGLLSSSGAITPPAQHKGVALKDLVELMGGMDQTQGLYIEATDGYGITFSYDQVMSGDFTTYDPSNGSENKVEGPLTAIVAYERDGAMLDPVQDGQLRAVVVSPKADNLIDGHWMVKWVSHIELKDTGAKWILHLKGAISEDMDRATFESGSSAHCHLEAWTDEEGNEWTGIPLWYLMGRVDDAVRHESRAFDEDLANAGYTITITAADGYSIELNSKDAAFNDEWIVALNENGEPISDKNYPLRLVGNGLTKEQMIGAIDSITLDIEPLPEATEAPATQEPTDDARTMEGDLVISGNVEFTMPFQYDELKDMDVVTINTKHPKKDEMRDYEGVRLNDLLTMAKPKADATKLTFVAGDGYSTTLPLADVLACADCLISFGDDNTLNSVMPGMDSGFWAKDVKQIVIE
ncbi:MAG: hypothetical protein ABFD14_13010 [Anaerolineaceae bacterium]